MWCCQRAFSVRGGGVPHSALAAHCRSYVSSKLTRRRRDFEEKTYPRASTAEPNRLPRRGRRGSWMRNPSRGVAKLDGTNSAQRAWWDENAWEVDQDFVSKLQGLQSDTDASAGKGSSVGGPAFQDVLDAHLAKLDELKVQMPSAEQFRVPHIRSLAKTPKPNPVHEAAVGGAPPLRVPEEPEEPPFLAESLANRRQRRRGRFLGARQEAKDTVGQEPHPSSPRMPALSSRKAAWMEMDSDEDDSSDSDEDAPEPAKLSLQGRRSARKAAASASSSSSSTAGPQVESPIEPMDPLRETSLGNLWGARGASWVEYNRCIVPSTFTRSEDSREYIGATMDSYYHTRHSASLIDVSFKVGLRVTGADKEFVADQFLTCSLRSMRSGDVQYACVLDSKGLILDDAFVYLTDDSVEILTSGCHSKQVVEYLSQYVIYVRRSGADVAFALSPSTTALALQGPKSRESLIQALSNSLGPSRLQLMTSDGVKLAASVLEGMPYMSALVIGRSDGSKERATLLCAGTTGEDGFEILGMPGQLIEDLAETLLAQEDLVRPAGIYCLDMLRMEAGLPRVGTDIAAGKITPVQAALAWTLDQSKMRSHLMFGWQKLFFQLAKGPQKRRIGLLLDGPAHTGCKILSNPHRQPIGEICSTAWSPELKCRVAQAYVRPEYAKVNKHVIVTVPYNLPTHKMRSKAIKHWLRSGMLRSAYRRLVAACVVPLPFVPHRYPEPKRQQRASARLRTFSGDPQAPPSSPVPNFPYKVQQDSSEPPPRSRPRLHEATEPTAAEQELASDLSSLR